MEDPGTARRRGSLPGDGGRGGLVHLEVPLRAGGPAAPGAGRGPAPTRSRARRPGERRPVGLAERAARPAPRTARPVFPGPGRRGAPAGAGPGRSGAAVEQSGPRLADGPRAEGGRRGGPGGGSAAVVPLARPDHYPARRAGPGAGGEARDGPGDGAGPDFDPGPRGGLRASPFLRPAGPVDPAPTGAREHGLQHGRCRAGPGGAGRGHPEAELPAARRSPRLVADHLRRGGRQARAAGPRRDGGLAPGRGRLGLERGGDRAPAGGRGEPALRPGVGAAVPDPRLLADRPGNPSSSFPCITSSATSGRSRC